MRSITAAALTILVFFISGCGSADSVRPDNTADKPETPIQISKTASRDMMMSSRELEIKYAASITGDYRGPMSYPLVYFYLKHGYFPKNIEEYLRESTVCVWPAERSTGQPYKISESVVADERDLGKLAYIHESDKNAYFQIVVKNIVSGEYEILRFPQEIELTDSLERLALFGFSPGNLPDTVEDLAVNFEAQMMDIVSSTFIYGSIETEGRNPDSMQSCLWGNYFWIEEKMIPSFASSDPSNPYYLEFGYANIKGFPVQFKHLTLWDTDGRDESGNYPVDVYKRINASRVTPDMKTQLDMDQTNFLDPEVYWDQMTGMEYYYSTAKIPDGSLVLPDEVVITIDEILSE